jgi:hypothetical protein
MSLIQALNEWTASRMTDLKKSYRSEGLKASGNWERELTSNVDVSINRINIVIEGANYTEQLIRGRGKTKTSTRGNPTLREAIRQWIDDKGLNPTDITKDSLAFLISRKIHRDGIKVPNRYNSGTFIDRVFYTSDGTLTQFRNILNKHYSSELKREITQGL